MDTGDVTDSSAEKQIELPLLSVSIIKLVESARSQHGLRHSDYLRYRQYCSRRVRRIRKSTKFLYGKNRFQKKEIVADNVTDERLLLLVLFYVERCWGFANQLRHESESSSNSRISFHFLRKLSKAVKYGNELRDLCEKRGDELTKMEVEAYTSTIEAELQLQHEDFEGALESFVIARRIYEYLSQKDATYTDICNLKIQEIDPQIRYCNHNLKNSVQDHTKFTSPELDEIEKSLKKIVFKSKQNKEDNKVVPQNQQYDIIKAHASVYLDKVKTGEESKKLIEDFIGLPCKPILFDLAHGELEFPSIEAKKADPNKQKKGGWLSSFWGSS